MLYRAKIDGIVQSDTVPLEWIEAYAREHPEQDVQVVDETAFDSMNQEVELIPFSEPLTQFDLPTEPTLTPEQLLQEELTKVREQLLDEQEKNHVLRARVFELETLNG